MISEFVVTQDDEFNIANLNLSVPGIDDLMLANYLRTSDIAINIFEGKYIPTKCLVLVYRKLISLLKKETKNRVLSSNRLYLDVIGYEFKRVS